MRLNDQEVLTPPRAAATVVLLRDGAAGPEVFMVRRHGLSDVLGGAYVFPGGKVDPTDADAAAHDRLDAPPPALHVALGEPDLDEAAAVALFVAACRETFEESGVLLGCGATAAHAAHAARLVRDGLTFTGALATLGLPLDCGNLVPWSRWITPRVPSMMSKRFDTRFFVIALPPGQQAVHDDHEADESVWVAAREALTRYWAGEISLAPPQIMSLAHLARHARVADVLAEARARPPALIEPHPFDLDGTRVLTYPGDERHPIRVRALPGPLRLIARNNRFEPPGGFEEFFG